MGIFFTESTQEVCLHRSSEIAVLVLIEDMVVRTTREAVFLYWVVESLRKAALLCITESQGVRAKM